MFIIKYVYIIIFIYIYIWWSPFISSRNLDEVFTYNHMALMSLQIRSHIKVSTVLTRSDHLFIHMYMYNLFIYMYVYYSENL